MEVHNDFERGATPSHASSPNQKMSPASIKKEGRLNPLKSFFRPTPASVLRSFDHAQREQAPLNRTPDEDTEPENIVFFPENSGLLPLIKGHDSQRTTKSGFDFDLQRTQNFTT